MKKINLLLLNLFIVSTTSARLSSNVVNKIDIVDQDKAPTPTIRHNWNAQSAWLKSIAENPICKEVAKIPFVKK